VVGAAVGGSVGHRRALADVEDRWAVALIVAFAALCLLVGLRNGQSTLDVDEVVYQQPSRRCRRGQGYYDATRDALVAKEGAPPIPGPVGSGRRRCSWCWRRSRGGLALASAVSLVLPWRIGRSRLPLGGPLAVVAFGLWLVGAAPLLYLHAELWGLPFALVGVLAMRNGLWVWAAIAFGAATCTRELYAAFLLVWLAAVPAKRLAWALVTVVVGALGRSTGTLPRRSSRREGRRRRSARSGASLGCSPP
jgi:hypothetical protein